FGFHMAELPAQLGDLVGGFQCDQEGGDREQHRNEVERSVEKHEASRRSARAADPKSSSAGSACASRAPAAPGVLRAGSGRAPPAVLRSVSTSRRSVRPALPSRPGGGNSACAGDGRRSPPPCIAIR